MESHSLILDVKNEITFSSSTIVVVASSLRSKLFRLYYTIGTVTDSGLEARAPLKQDS
jgi:hypothetical protein